MKYKSRKINRKNIKKRRRHNKSRKKLKNYKYQQGGEPFTIILAVIGGLLVGLSGCNETPLGIKSDIINMATKKSSLSNDLREKIIQKAKETIKGSN